MGPIFLSLDIENSINELFQHFFSSRFLNLSAGLLRRKLVQKFAARWRYRFPIKNLVFFCVSFKFFLSRKPENAFKCVNWA